MLQIDRSKYVDVSVSPLWEDIANDLDTSLQVEEHDRGAYQAAIEWMVAATAVVWFTKPFFNKLLETLGGRTGALIADAIADQFRRGKAANERMRGRKDLEEAIELQKSGKLDELAKLGRPIAPLELRIITTAENRQVTVRLIFPPNLVEDEVRLATSQLRSFEELLRRLREFELPPNLPDHVSVNLTAIYDKDAACWLSRSEWIAALRRSSGH